MRAVQITRFGGLEVLDIVDLPEPTPGPGHQLYDVSTAGVNYADTHHRWASRMARRCCPELTGAGRFSRAISPRRTPYAAPYRSLPPARCLSPPAVAVRTTAHEADPKPCPAPSAAESSSRPLLAARRDPDIRDDQR
jgi:hypothetical protein